MTFDLWPLQYYESELKVVVVFLLDVPTVHRLK